MDCYSGIAAGGVCRSGVVVLGLIGGVVFWLGVVGDGIALAGGPLLSGFDVVGWPGWPAGGVRSVVMPGVVVGV